jgi:uncharacterized protein (TIGR02466 family)
MNVSTKGDYQEYHNHPNCHFSLAYYVKAPENSGKIVFKSHEQDMLPLPVAKYNDYSSTVVSIKPKESMMVAFRSNLLHMVEQNKSDEERISITMNFIVK